MGDGTRIAELAERLGRIAHGLQFACGLNPAQWQALRFIDRANEFSCTPTALAEFLGTTKGTVSQTLTALEAKGLIVRRRCPEDRRSVKFEVTLEGARMLEDDPLALVADACASMPREMCESLVEGLARVVRELQTAKGMTAFGSCGDCAHLEGAPGDAACRCRLSGARLDCATLEKICADFVPAC